MILGWTWFPGSRDHRVHPFNALLQKAAGEALTAEQAPHRPGHRPGARSARWKGRRRPCNAGHSQNGDSTMRFLSWLDGLKPDSSRRRTKRGGARSPRRKPAGQKLFVERLEDRIVPG